MGSRQNILGSIPLIIRNDEGMYEGNLVHYFQVFFRHATNLWNPYHNFRHTCHVLWLCYDACGFYGDQISPRDKRSLLIAAMFHDFDHTGKPGPDHLNIERALAALERHLLPEDRDQGVEFLVTATEYPYSPPHEALGLTGLILRDADVGQAFSVAWIQQVIFGLAAEWGKDPLDVLKLQEPFCNNLRFQTQWARELFPPQVVETKVREANELIDLLTAEPAEASQKTG